MIDIQTLLRYPKRLISILLIMTVFFSFGINWLYIDDDMMKMLPEEIPSRVSWEEIQDEFGNVDLMFVTVGIENKSIFTQKSLEIIWDITEALSKIETVDEVMSISTLQKIESSDGFMDVSDLQSDRSITDNELKSIQQYINKNPKILNQFFDSNFFYTNIIIRPIVNVNNNELVNAILPITQPFSSQLEVHYSGQPYLTGYVPELIQKDVSILMRIGIGIMILILLANLKSIKAVGMVLSVILLSLIAMMGFMGWMLKVTGSNIFYFTMVNSSMPIILLTIANSDGVHVIAKFFKEFRNRKDKRQALEETVKQLNLPIFLTSFTTIIAFLTLISAPINPLIGYGITLGFGIFWAWILSTLFLPAIIYLSHWDIHSKSISEESFIEKFVHFLNKIIFNSPKLILTFCLIVGIIAGYFSNKVKVDVDFKSFFGKGTIIRDGMDFMDEKMGGYLNMVVKIEDDIKSPEILQGIESLQTEIEKSEDISLSFSIADVVKQMHRSIEDDNPKFETIPDSVDKVNNLFFVYSMSGDDDDFSTIVNEDYSEGLINVRLKSVSTEVANDIVKNTEIKISQLFNESSKITITGILVVIRDMAILLVKSSFLNIFSAIIFIFFISWYFFRSAIWGFLAVLPLSFAVLLNYGVMGFLDIKLSHVTAILSSIIIGVGVDFAIHFIAQYREQMKKGDLKNISQNVITDVGFPIFLDAGSNMAFIALIFSAFAPVKYIGILMFFAMVSCSLSTILILGPVTYFLKNKLTEKN